MSFFLLFLFFLFCLFFYILVWFRSQSASVFFQFIDPLPLSAFCRLFHLFFLSLISFHRSLIGSFLPAFLFSGGSLYTHVTHFKFTLPLQKPNAAARRSLKSIVTVEKIAQLCPGIPSRVPIRAWENTVIALNICEHRKQKTNYPMSLGASLSEASTQLLAHGWPLQNG